MVRRIYLNKRVNLFLENSDKSSFKLLLQGSQGFSSFNFNSGDFIKLGQKDTMVLNFAIPDNYKLFFPTKLVFNTFFTLFKNSILGVQYGFFKEFKLNGVGYYVWVDGSFVYFDLGFGNIYRYSLPDGVFAYAKKNKFFLYGVSKIKVSQIASLMNKLRYPDVYKNKGLVLVGKTYRKKDRIKAKK